jgi:hypothetical protein
VATTNIVWNWATNTDINFNAATDILDFGWFAADQFTISEISGTVVIAIPSNHQTYTLQHTTLNDLHLSNIVAKDASAISEWTTVLGNAPVTPPGAARTAGHPSRCSSEQRCDDLVGGQHLHHRHERDGERRHWARSVADHWAELRAGEIFAEYFRGNADLRAKVIDAFRTNPDNAGAAGALAELLLREDDAVVEERLVAGVQGRRYWVGTHFKLVAALSSADAFIDEVARLLTRDIEPDEWSLPYWVPALGRTVPPPTDEPVKKTV